MRPLSDTTHDKLTALYAKVPVLERFLGGSDAQVRLISDIGLSGEGAAVPFLAPFLRRQRTRVAAASAIATLMEGLPIRDLAQLDNRRGFSFTWRDEGDLYREWVGVTPRVVADLDDGTDDSVWVLGLLSFHWSGYVRERAVQHLVRRSVPIAVPFLLIRANDWVLEVRQRAKLGLRTLASSLGPKGFGSYLPLVERLEGTHRDDHHEIVETLTAMFSGTRGTQAIASVTGASDRFVRRAAYRRAFALEDGKALPFIHEALEDEDTIVRAIAARRCLAMPLAERKAWLKVLLRDRQVTLRRLALYAWVETFPRELATPCFISLLLDRSAGVRGAAQFYIHRDLGLDLPRHYRAHFDDPAPRRAAAALLGFGETAERSSSAEVLPYLAVDSSTIRTAAVTALGRLADRETVEPFIVALQDTSPGVSRAGREALAQRPASVAKVSELLGGRHAEHTEVNILKLTCRPDRWNGLADLLDVASMVRGRPLEWVHAGVRRWIEHFGMPAYVTRAQSEWLERLVREHHPELGTIEGQLHRMHESWLALPRFTQDWE